jgi:hypothetical protein
MSRAGNALGAAVAVAALVYVHGSPWIGGNEVAPAAPVHEARADATTTRPTATARQPTLAVAPVTPIAPAAALVAKTDGVIFARQYADALCACTAVACLDEVRDRYARRAGEAQPSTDVRSVHEAFLRGQACIQTVRAASSGPRG